MTEEEFLEMIRTLTFFNFEKRELDPDRYARIKDYISQKASDYYTNNILPELQTELNIEEFIRAYGIGFSECMSVLSKCMSVGPKFTIKKDLRPS